MSYPTKLARNRSLQRHLVRLPLLHIWTLTVPLFRELSNARGTNAGYEVCDISTSTLNRYLRMGLRTMRLSLGHWAPNTAGLLGPGGYFSMS